MLHDRPGHTTSTPGLALENLKCCVNSQRDSMPVAFSLRCVTPTCKNVSLPRVKIPSCPVAARVSSCCPVRTTGRCWCGTRTRSRAPTRATRSRCCSPSCRTARTRTPSTASGEEPRAARGRGVQSTAFPEIVFESQKKKKKIQVRISSVDR